MKRSEVAISVSLVPVDYLMIILAGIAAYYFRFWDPIKSIRPVIFNLPFWFFFNWLLLMALVWIICFAISGLYAMRGTSRAIDEISKIALASSTAIAILMFFFFFSRSLFDSRFIILAAWILSIIFVIIGRGLVRFVQKWLYRANIGVHRVVVIGESHLTQGIIASFVKNVRAGYRVVDQFADFNDQTEAALLELKKQDKIDEKRSTGSPSRQHLGEVNTTIIRNASKTKRAIQKDSINIY